MHTSSCLHLSLVSRATPIAARTAITIAMPAARFLVPTAIAMPAQSEEFAQQSSHSSSSLRRVVRSAHRGLEAQCPADPENIIHHDISETGQDVALGHLKQTQRHRPHGGGLRRISRAHHDRCVAITLPKAPSRRFSGLCLQFCQFCSRFGSRRRVGCFPTKGQGGWGADSAVEQAQTFQPLWTLLRFRLLLLCLYDPDVSKHHPVMMFL